MFEVTILSARREIFVGVASSVIVPGDEGEFEVLELHKPVLSLLSEGAIVVDGRKRFPVTRGAVNFVDNKLVALVEEPDNG